MHSQGGVIASFSVPEKNAYLFLLQFPRRRHHSRIMVSLEYLPYYWKLFNHIWQLYTLVMGNFSTCLNLTFDFYQDDMIKNSFLGYTRLSSQLSKIY